MRWRLVPLAALMGVLAMAPLAGAGAPTDQLRSAVDRAIKTLDDPEFKKPARAEERRAQVRAAAQEIFNFKELARRTLARHWRERTPEEQEEFAALFAELLERAYLGKIELYRGEKVRYTDEKVEEDYATISTMIVTKEGPEVPVEYRMLRNGTRWEVYDVVVEGVSLVANYRSQFNRIIQTSGYAELVKRLRAKQVEIQPPGEGKAKPKSKGQ
ncbi:MAG: ABC transporter substrate-binding protein [Candidatus Rokubacteria bacterium]|nr:ABC transporter substrate-binding protein [Candidatus Rokubacteria bacterium]